MKVGDMKETIGGFKFLTPAETEKSMTSGNLAGFLKGIDTPRRSSWYKLFTSIIILEHKINFNRRQLEIDWCLFF